MSQSDNETTALIVVDPQPEPEKVKPPPEYREIKNNDFLHLKREGHENAPQSDKPFYLVAGDGLFLNKNTILGKGWLKQKYYPSWLPKLGGEQFTWEIDKIPAEVCAQVHGFFKRIYEKHKTEAEVVFLMNHETKEWEIYIPWQKVSGSHVTSAVIPEEIPITHQIVGSAHSHADMSAFHSGTDIGDASDMDGVHFTLGRFDEEKQEVVSMVMVNGVEFTYKPEEVADWSNRDAATAPEEWDDRVYPYSRMGEMTDELKEIFVKYGKERSEPKKTTTTWKPYDYDKAKKPHQYNYNLLDDWDDYGYEGWQKNWIDGKRRKPTWESTGKENIKPDLTEKAKLDAGYWEDFLEDKTIDLILEASIFSEDDWDRALENTDSNDIEWWRTLFLRKLSENVTILGKLGLVVDYQAYPKASNEPRLTKREARRLRKLRLEQNKAESDDLLPVDGDFVEVDNDGNISLEDRLKAQGFDLLKVEKDEDGTERVYIDVGKFKLED